MSPITSNSIPLGIYAKDNQVYFYYLQAKNKTFQLKIDTSSDGLKFADSGLKPVIKDSRGKAVELKNLRDFKISSQNGQYFLVAKNAVSTKRMITIAKSGDLITWDNAIDNHTFKETSLIVPDFQYDNRFLVLTGEENLSQSLTGDFLKWSPAKSFLTARQDFFGSSPLKIGSVLMTEQGILVYYFVKQGKEGKYRYEVRTVTLDRANPDVILDNPEEAFWETPEEWFKDEVMPVGIIEYQKQLISYWETRNGLYSVVHPVLLSAKDAKKQFYIILKKSEENPIIKPIESHYWESKATFNPAAVYDKGKVHILYRAIGDSDVSVIGYAQSSDGTHIDKRIDEPVYLPREPFEGTSPDRPKDPGFISPFTSGGGCYGGCEDPRITKIKDTLYMTYVAYDGFNGPKVALSSISSDDFHKGDWKKWKKPVIISNPKVIDKNACILPDTINGKYVVFHRVFPDILVDYVDSLDFDGKNFLKGQYKISPRKNFWDSRKVGAGAPPVETKDGWLMIYQAVGNQDAGKYKMGAMLLDKKDPKKVLFRSAKPILEPDEWYENEGWKAGVAYPCGSVIMDDKLLVYYGGADMVTCVAEANLNEFLDRLETNQSAELTPLSKHAFAN